jgi:hypothetical protein
MMSEKLLPVVHIQVEHDASFSVNNKMAGFNLLKWFHQRNLTTVMSNVGGLKLTRFISLNQQEFSEYIFSVRNCGKLCIMNKEEVT